jgi:hypothetical protein
MQIADASDILRLFLEREISGTKRAAKIATTAITTNISVSVNAAFLFW